MSPMLSSVLSTVYFSGRCPTASRTAGFASGDKSPQFGGWLTGSSGQDIVGWRAQTTVPSGLAVFAPLQLNVSFEQGAKPEQPSAAAVYANLLEALGVRQRCSVGSGPFSVGFNERSDR
jgi:hypothetical protein